jgi:hypothetical protein
MAEKITVPRDVRQMILDKCPRNEDGDPAFTDLAQIVEFLDADGIVGMTNEWLYQQDYQRVYHRKRAALQKEARKRQAEEARQTVVTNRRSIGMALRKIRKEVDVDLGPSGVFSTEGLKPLVPEPQEDTQALDALNNAFATEQTKERHD